MPLPFEPEAFINTDACRNMRTRLGSLYADMDREYDAVAGQYEFQCSGCTDNCCLTRFYHHTLIEYIYIYSGFQTLEPAVRDQAKQRAREACLAVEAAEQKEESPRVMCPLNADGLCMIYAHRPMICRLHGIPHELRPPGKDAVYHPGCDEFSKQTSTQTYIRFDRTPFYMNMAGLENTFRRETGISHKIRLTVAQMIETF